MRLNLDFQFVQCWGEQDKLFIIQSLNVIILQENIYFSTSKYIQDWKIERLKDNGSLSSKNAPDFEYNETINLLSIII